MTPSPSQEAARRVVVTGRGLCVPEGVGREAAWASALAGTSPARHEVHGSHPAIRIDGFDPKQVVDRKKALKLMGPNIQFALGASREAWAESGREPRCEDGLGAGIVLGVRTRPNDFPEFVAVTRGSHGEDKQFCARRFGEEGANAIFPLSMLRGLPNLVTSQVTIQLGLHGFSDSLTSGDVSGLQALHEGAQVLLRGDADLVIAGGADDLLDPISLGRVLAESERAGEGEPPVISQGAAALVLEDSEAAACRGARILAELVGSAEAFGDADALAWSWQEALRRAGRAPEDVTALWLDATLLGRADLVVPALEAVFAEVPRPPALCSQARRLGRMGAATGAVEAAYAIEALVARRLPPGDVGIRCAAARGEVAAAEELGADALMLVSSASDLGNLVTLAWAGPEVGA